MDLDDILDLIGSTLETVAPLWRHDGDGGRLWSPDQLTHIDAISDHVIELFEVAP